MKNKFKSIGLAIGLALLPVYAGAESVYKCISHGQAHYQQQAVEGGDCKVVELRNDEPSPADVAWAFARKQRAAEIDAAAHEQVLRERSVEAQEAQAQAEQRRAAAVEEQVLQLRNQPAPAPVIVYPTWYRWPVGGGYFPPPREHKFDRH
jgi:hypothetical protein